MTDEITYLPLNQYRYETQLRHLTELAKQPGCWDYATKRSRELAEREPDVYGKLPADLWQRLRKTINRKA